MKRLGYIIVTATLLTAGAAWACTDYDHDGHCSIATGGDDCDDYDAERFPGNAEICDSAYHDEDCDPTTFGKKDSDSDGEYDAACCNYSATQWYCGLDCDDSNPGIRNGSQICDAKLSSYVLVCRNGGWTRAACGSTMTCARQPNGTGVCR